MLVAHKDFFKSEAIRMLGKLEAGESLDEAVEASSRAASSSALVESSPEERTLEKKEKTEKMEKKEKNEKKDKVFLRRLLTLGAMPL